MIGRWTAVFLVLVTGVAGLCALREALGNRAVVVAAVIIVLTAFVKFNEIAGRLLGAAVVGTLVLLGFNTAFGKGRSIEVGLVLAVAIFAGAAAWYLHGTKPPTDEEAQRRKQDARFLRVWHWAVGRGAQWGWWSAGQVAVALAVLLIIDVPVLITRREDESATALALVVLGALAVVIGQVVWCLYKQASKGWQRPAAIFGVLVPVVGVVLLGLVPFVVPPEKVDLKEIADREAVGVQVHIRIVSDGSEHAPPPAVIEQDPDLNGFTAHYSVGVAESTRVRWTLTDTTDRREALRVLAAGAAAGREPRPRPVPAGADSLLVLLADGSAPMIDPDRLEERTGDDVERWRSVRRAAGGSELPTYVVLETAKADRLARWEGFSSKGGIASLQRQNRPNVTELGLALAVRAPTATADLALAVRHRPILLFDSKERVPRPLSVDWLFGSGKISQCTDGERSQPDCERVTDPAKLSNGGTHLQIDQSGWERAEDQARLQKLVDAEFKAASDIAVLEPKPGTVPGAAQPAEVPEASAQLPDTAIYVNTVSASSKGRELLYLDYWWFLPDNPVDVGGGAFCGPGMVIPGITCHNHESDWEGLTVVLDRTKEPVIKSVHYAQHSKVVRYRWEEELRPMWDTDEYHDYIAGVENGEVRPLAFVAGGTHATYPEHCRGGCKQFADPELGEGRHDGKLRWIGNVTNECRNTSCVHRFPTRAEGRQPAHWNAFIGPWGVRDCALGYYCKSGTPPSAPATQARYRNPIDCHGWARPTNGRPKYNREACTG